MRPLRLRRQVSTCRSLLTFVLVVTVSLAAARTASADTLSGVVVDEAGRPVPRALVRVAGPAGVDSASTFSDERGRFGLDAPRRDCRVEASLSGFAAASAPCDAGELRLVMKVAPVAETVVVTATRTEAPSAQVGASVTTFTATDLANRREPLVADLLRSVPGAMVVRTGQPGAVTSLFVRGGESTYNKVLLDGIPLNEPGGTFNFSNISTNGLERIEIVRGAQSALFGSDAMSSVVQLFTTRPNRAAPRPEADFAIEGGTYGTVRGRAAAMGISGPLDYSVGVARETTDNRDPNSGFRNTTVSGNAGVSLGSTATLRFVGRGELGHAGTPGQTAFGRPDLDAFFERHDGVGGVTLDHQLTPAFRERASYSLTVSHQQSTNLIADPPYTPRYGTHVAPFPFSDFRYDTFNNLHRHHASYQGDVRLANDAERGGQLLTVLADWDGERATLEDRLANTSTPASRDNVGVAVQHQAVWRRIVATGGVRYEHDASFGGATVGRGSVVAVLREGPLRGVVGDTRLRASAGTGVKEPTILQSFSPSPFFRGNPDLLPERSRSVEAGIEQRLANDRVRLDAAWFANRYENLISTRTTNPATFEASYFNIGLTRARGLELSGDAAPVPLVHVRAGYTFLASEILDSTSPSSLVLRQGQWLFRRPRHSGFAGVSLARGPLTVGVNGVLIGRFVDSDFSSLQPPILENPGYTTWDVRASYAVTAHVSALLAIDNAANEEYMEPLGYRALGRAARIGARVKF